MLRFIIWFVMYFIVFWLIIMFKGVLLFIDKFLNVMILFKLSLFILFM